MTEQEKERQRVSKRERKTSRVSEIVRETKRENPQQQAKVVKADLNQEEFITNC